MSTYRLPSDIRADLEWYWCRADADLGVHSNMAATIMRANLLTHAKETRTPEDRPSGIRLALAQSQKPKRIEARNEALRLYFLFGTPKLDHGAVSDPMPERSERARRQLIRIHDTMCRLRQSPNGVAHQRVLFWLYGDEFQARRVDELDCVLKHIPNKKKADEAASDASKAYAACHEAEMGDRRRERRERFMAMLGAA